MVVVCRTLRSSEDLWLFVTWYADLGTPYCAEGEQVFLVHRVKRGREQACSLQQLPRCAWSGMVQCPRYTAWGSSLFRMFSNQVPGEFCPVTTYRAHVVLCEHDRSIMRTVTAVSD